MPRTAELAMHTLCDLWEERKRSVCPWMGGGHDLYWDAATLWKTLVAPSIFYKAQECLYYKTYLCCSHLQDMILRCSLQVFVAFHHYLSLEKKVIGRTVAPSFSHSLSHTLKHKPSLTSTSVQERLWYFLFLQKSRTTLVLWVWDHLLQVSHMKWEHA